MGLNDFFFKEIKRFYDKNIEL